jgi:hypothetical protein
MTDNRTWKDIAGVMHQACIDKNPELAVDVYEDFSIQQLTKSDIVEELRKEATDWKQTAQMLAIDLGKIEYAEAVYEDVQSGLYEKVRGRLKTND